MDKRFFRDCSNCGKQQSYKHKKGRHRAEAKSSICRSCVNRLFKTGVPLTAAHKASICAGSKGKPSQYKAEIKEACHNLYGPKLKYTNTRAILKWGKEVRERDNETCCRCNTVATGHYIHAHHIVPKEYFPETAFDTDNGITLCNSCHRSLHAFLDKLSLSGIKLDAEGFRTHTTRFVAGNRTSSQDNQTPLGYTSVFKPSVTITKE
jgi:hypothetical protein